MADPAGSAGADETARSIWLTEVAAEAAQAVADDLLAAFRSQMAVSYKRDSHDPVTAHDRAAEARIREVILSRVPDSTVVGEEGGAQGTGSVRWYVDPIDGTANFARGLAFFCTSVGAVVDDRVVAGAVLDPVAGHLFTASLDGAWLNGTPLRSQGVPDEARALLLTSYPSARELTRDGAPVATDRLARLIGAVGTVRRVGSAALTLAHVAAGWADAAFGTSVSAWDVCAAQLLVVGAGGVYRPFRVGGGGAGRWDSPGYLAHTGAFQPATVGRVVDELAGGTAPSWRPA